MTGCLFGTPESIRFLVWSVRSAVVQWHSGKITDEPAFVRLQIGNQDHER